MVRILGCLRCFVIASVVATIIALSWIIWVFNREYRQCVQLPNGLYLGYSSVFDVSNAPYFTPSPEGTIKYSNGEPLIDQKIWNIFVSDTAVNGTIYGAKRLQAFGWSVDRGFVLASDAPEAYKGIINEAGKHNYGLGSQSVGPVILMKYLAKKQGFKVRWCQTRLLKW